jgi:hypothetical protein
MTVRVPKMKRKLGLIQDDVTRDDQLLSHQIDTSVAFVGGRITKEDTRGRSWRQFVGSGGGYVGITEATEYSKIMIGRCFVMEELERGGVGVLMEGSRLMRKVAMGRASTQ